MRILMTADTVGGVWTYALELARALAPSNIEVHLATMGTPLKPDQAANASAVPNLRVHESTYKLEWMEDPWEDVDRAGDWLLELADQIRPEVVHLNNYAHGSLPWQAPTLVVAHSCVLSWWRAVKGEPAPENWRRYGRAVYAGIHTVDAVAAPTRAMLDALQSHYGTVRRSLVIYNGRSAQNFQPADKDPFILTAGRLWDEAKNVAALQRIAPRLAWPVYVAGDAQHPSGGAASTDGVQSLGFLSAAELGRYTGRASIYALPARYEPFGLSALEAALCGCALVLGDIPSLREVWGDAALFVPPDDSNALEAVLQQLIEDDARRTNMGTRAWNHAKHYTPERMATEYRWIYQQLTGTAVTTEPQAGDPAARVW